MMNFTTNAVSQPFHVAVFTFHDVLKDATRIKMEMWMGFFFSFFFLNVNCSALQRLCHLGD